MSTFVRQHLPKLLATATLLTIAPFLRAADHDITVGYMDHDALTGAVNSLANRFEACTLDRIGTSREDRDLFVLTLASDPGTHDQRPALLITAGIDGRHWVGTETAVRVAQRLLGEHAALLEDVTVYVLPRVNPDGAAMNFGRMNRGHVGNARPIDLDRDGETTEDGPDDLLDDGVITQMRRPNPPLDDDATHMADPAEPRLLKKPDPSQGEEAVYSIYVEGHDDDGDGLIAEDGPEGVDLNRNFMHLWPEHEQGAGPHQVSEPESLALAEFVVEHRNIVAAVTYGRHDNMIHIPDHRQRDATGRVPTGIHPDDRDLYNALSDLFKETTGQRRAPNRDSAGSFHAWLYAQRGIVSVATVVWGRPDPSEPEDDADKLPWERDDDLTPADEEAALWLAYSDRDRDGVGFVEWQTYEHPDLGEVEIGGFVPGFRMNPPAEELDDIAEHHAAFAVKLIEQRPRFDFTGPDVTRLASGLYEVRFGLVNRGRLPTTTAMSRQARAMLPTVVRLSTPIEQIVAGDRLSRVWGIDGSGDRHTIEWTLRVDDGESIAIELTNHQLGDVEIRFTADENTTPEITRLTTDREVEADQ